MSLDLASPPSKEQLPLIADAESSSGRNVWGPQTDSGQAEGDYQITTGTWRDFAPKAGVDLSKYPDPNSAPKEIQQQVAQTIPLGRWDPRTLAKLGGNASGAAQALNVGGQGDIQQLFGGFKQMLGTPDSSWMAPTISALRGDLTAERQELAGINRQIEGELADDKSRVKKAFDAASKDDTTPWTQPPPDRDALQGFASAGSIFAAIASMFTRTPAISAMNGMAAAINARRDGNEKQYNEAYKVWQENTKLAIDRQKLASDRLSQALDLMKTDSAEGLAKARQVMLEHGDERGLLMAEAGMWKELDEANQARNRTAATLAIESQRILNPGMKQEILTDPGTKDENGNPIQYIHHSDAQGRNFFTTLNGEPFTPHGAAKMAAGASGGTNPLTPDTADMQARFYLRTGQMSAGFGGQGMRQQILERATEIAKQEGQTVDDYLSGRATLKADTASLGAVTKQKNAAEGYERGAIGALDLTVKSLPHTPEPLNMPLFTRWVRTGATEFGDVEVPVYQAQLISALDQYAKVLSGATGAQGSTDSARALALSLIPPGATSQQVPAIVEQLKKDMQIKIDGYTTQEQVLRNELSAPPSPRGGASSAPGLTPAKTEGAPDKSAAGNTIFTVTDEQQKALPSGTWYRFSDDPEGSHRVRK